jgi:hypothetical protein
MKVLKVHIKRDRNEARTHYDYPPEYDAQKIQVMVYESSLPENFEKVVGRGDTDEYLIGVVKDEDAPQFLASPDIEEIDTDTALELGESWTRPIERITDPKVVTQVTAKMRAGIKLTQAEENAVDPDNPAPGVVKSRTFRQSLAEMLGADFKPIKHK